MKKQKIMTLQDALDRGTVKNNHHFLVIYPDGREGLFRLIQTKKGLVMWGPPTDEKISLSGKDGYDNLFTLADAQARKEYSLSGVFEDVHACGLPESECECNSLQELFSIMENAKSIYGHSSDAKMVYALKSRCVRHSTDTKWLGVFYVNDGNVYVSYIVGPESNIYNYIYAVRPEAIPNPMLRLFVEGNNGSRNNPWICFRS